jgi:TPR repeat protein
MTLLRPLAEKGDANAQFQVGVMFSGGQGVKQDLPEAIRWFRLAADQGNADAQYSLGQEYAIGDGIEKNPEEAYFWLDLASNGYDAAGRATAGNAKALRDRVGQKLSPDELRKAQERSKAWAPK